MVKAGSSSAEQGGLAVIISFDPGVELEAARSDRPEFYHTIGKPRVKKDIDLVVAVVRVAQPGNDTADPLSAALHEHRSSRHDGTDTTATRRYQPHLQPLLAAVPHLKFVISRVTCWMDQPRMRLSPVRAAYSRGCGAPRNCQPSIALPGSFNRASKPCSASVEPSCGPHEYPGSGSPPQTCQVRLPW